MLTGYLRRNGAMTSDQATIITHFILHGDMLTLAAQLDDPIYLTEPYYITRTFVKQRCGHELTCPVLHRRR